MSVSIESTINNKIAEERVSGVAPHTVQIDPRWSSVETEEFVVVSSAPIEGPTISLAPTLSSEVPSLDVKNEWVTKAPFVPRALRVKNSDGDDVDLPVGDKPALSYSQMGSVGVSRVKSKVSDDETLVRSWIDSEYDIDLHRSKTFLFNLLMVSLAKSGYSSVWKSTDIIQYLTESSQSFFRTVVSHPDTLAGNVLRLWDWNAKGSHVYIFTVSRAPTRHFDWAVKQRSKLDSIRENNLVENEDDDWVISKKGYSILRRHAIKALCMEFMKLTFFKKFDDAKKFTINSNTSGDFINFIKKVPVQRSDDEIPLLEERTDQQDL